MILLENFLTVSGQALSLFIMIALGVLLYKAKLFRHESITDITNILLWGITPCLIVNTFLRPFERELALSLGVFALLSAVAMTLTAVCTFALFRKQDRSDRGIMSFATTFTNCGFMGLPLAQALFGYDGVIYASIFVAVFNFLQWTLGFYLLSGKSSDGTRTAFPVKRLLLNPGVIGIAIGLPLFLFSVSLPGSITGAVSSIAEVNTPLAMIVIGAHLADGDILKALRDRRVLSVCALRLLAVPAVALGIAALCGPLGLDLQWGWLPDKLAASVLIIELAAPCPATTVLIGTLCGHDGELSGRCVALSTLFSIATLPVVATACNILC